MISFNVAPTSSIVIKTTTKLLGWFAAVALLQSCTILVPLTNERYTSSSEKAQAFFSKLKTKRDVLFKLGPPSEKVYEDGLEIWTYDLGTTRRTTGGYTGGGSGNVRSTTGNQVKLRENYAGSLYSQTQYLSKYHQVYFEKGGSVVQYWRSNAFSSSGSTIVGSIFEGLLYDVLSAGLLIMFAVLFSL